MNPWRLCAIFAAVLLLSGAGCIVTKSKYDGKAAEIDELRSALAALNRENAKLAAGNAELSKRLAACSEREAILSGRDAAASEEASRAARLRLVDDLLEEEKAAAQLRESAHESGNR